MRRNSFFTTVSLILVLFLLGFAIYSLLYPLGKTRNQVSFIFADTNLYLEIEAIAEWVDESAENKNFYAVTQEGRLNSEIWNVPDIIFSTEEGNELREAEITILIFNKNPEREVKVTITQVAFDSDSAYLENPRFSSNVICRDGKTGEFSNNRIYNIDHKIESDILASPNSEDPDSENPNSEDPNFMVLTFQYKLERENIDFNFFQNLRIEFKTI